MFTRFFNEQYILFQLSGIWRKKAMHHENTFCQALPDASPALLWRAGQMDLISMDLSAGNVRSDGRVMSAGLQSCC
jgi:hypothetical protein